MKFEENSGEIGQQKPREDSVHFTRHSQAKYGSYNKIRASENPQGAVDPEDQLTPDLTEKGAELAEQKAEELLSQFDPQHDALFFASSDESRALETATIYRKIAHQKGFEILKPGKTGTQLADEIGEGEIRTIRNLSLNLKNVLLPSLFNPDSQNKDTNWEALDPETRRKCDEVRAIIAADDHGSFGANFFYHSAEVAKIFPEIKTVQETYEGQFKNLLRLTEFGLRKVKESGIEKNVKILAFGHENYMGYAMNKYFGEHDVKNCETIDIEVGTEGLTMSRRGSKERVEN